MSYLSFWYSRHFQMFIKHLHVCGIVLDIETNAHGPVFEGREQEEGTELLPGAHEYLYQTDCGTKGKHTPSLVPAASQ